jgi:hypothetical protein
VKRPLTLALGLFLVVTAAFSVYFFWPTKNASFFPFVGHANTGKVIACWVDQSDTFASFERCEDRVHAANRLTGGSEDVDAGYVEIAPHSLHAGKTRSLYRKYPDVYLRVRE